MLYTYCKMDGTDDFKAMYGDDSSRKFNIKYPFIFNIGSFKKGEIVSLAADNERKSGNAEIYVAYIDQELFDRGYELFSKDTMKLTKFTDTRVEGTVTASKDGLLYTSIPYGKLWTAYVDGAKSEIYTVSHAMGALKLTQGEHKIEFRYKNGALNVGILVSIFSLAAFIGLIFFRKLLYSRTKRLTAIEE